MFSIILHGSAPVSAVLLCFLVNEAEFSCAGTFKTWGWGEETANNATNLFLHMYKKLLLHNLATKWNL